MNYKTDWQRLPFWNILDEDQQELIKRHSTIYHIPKCAMVSGPTKNHQYAQYVLDGSVKLCRRLHNMREVILKIIRDGQVVSIQPLLKQKDSFEYSESLTECAIAQVRVDLLHSMMARCNALTEYFIQEIGKERNHLVTRFTQVHGSVFIRRQLAELLIEMADVLGKKVGDETYIEHNLTHREIASMIHRTRQSITEVLSELKRADIINYTRDSILIRDLKKLKKWGEESN
jgi:CRP-like cAMP-binding protein